MFPWKDIFHQDGIITAGPMNNHINLDRAGA